MREGEAASRLERADLTVILVGLAPVYSAEANWMPDLPVGLHISAHEIGLEALRRRQGAPNLLVWRINRLRYLSNSLAHQDLRWMESPKTPNPHGWFPKRESVS